MLRFPARTQSLKTLWEIKMKRFTIISSICSIVLLFSFTNRDGRFWVITKRGVGEAKINESKYLQVKKAFPKGKTSKETWGGKKSRVYAKLIDGQCIQYKIKNKKQIARTYTIDKEGISFYFNFLDTLSSITIWGKNRFKTDKGIIIGKSTFRDLDSLYGKSSFARIHTNLVKTHDNLIFYANDSIVLNKKDNNITDKFEDLKIEKIKVVIN